MKNLLIIEDLPEVSTWLVGIVMSVFPDAEVRVTPTLDAAQRLVDNFSPDLALIDLGLPDGDGTIITQPPIEDNPSNRGRGE